MPKSDGTIKIENQLVALYGSIKRQPIRIYQFWLNQEPGDVISHIGVLHVPRSRRMKRSKKKWLEAQTVFVDKKWLALRSHGESSRRHEDTKRHFHREMYNNNVPMTEQGFQKHAKSFEFKRSRILANMVCGPWYRTIKKQIAIQNGVDGEKVRPRIEWTKEQSSEASSSSAAARSHFLVVLK